MTTIENSCGSPPFCVRVSAGPGGFFRPMDESSRRFSLHSLPILRVERQDFSAKVVWFNSICLVVWNILEHQFYVPRNIGNLIIPIDEVIFFRGVALQTTNQQFFGSWKIDRTRHGVRNRFLSAKLLVNTCCNPHRNRFTSRMYHFYTC